MCQHLPDRDTIGDALTGALATEDVCPLPSHCPSRWLLHQPSSICHQRQQEVSAVPEAGPVSARDRGRAPSSLSTLPAHQRDQHKGLAGTHSLQKCHHLVLIQQRNVKKYMTCRKEKEMQCTCPYVTASTLAQVPPLLCSFSILHSKGLVLDTQLKIYLLQCH